MPLNTLWVSSLPALLLRSMALASPPHPQFVSTPWKLLVRNLILTWYCRDRVSSCNIYAVHWYCSILLDVQSDSEGNIIILLRESIGHCDKKVYMNMCLILSGHRDKAVRIYKYKSIVNVIKKEKLFTVNFVLISIYCFTDTSLTRKL
jgi:hypothetical protein